MLTLRIEIAGADPISGRLRAGEEPWEAFTGWLGLTRLLAELVDRDEDPSRGVAFGGTDA